MKYVSNFKKIGNDTIMRVIIRLSDPCKNGYDNFAITFDEYERYIRGQHSPYEDRVNYKGVTYIIVSCGSDNEHICNHFPEFVMYTHLHLSDFRGVPMYPISNSRYHLGKSGVGVFQNYLRLTDDEASLFSNCNDACDSLGDLHQPEDALEQIILKYLYQNDITDRWISEALFAIIILEHLSATTYDKYRLMDTSLKDNWDYRYKDLRSLIYEELDKQKLEQLIINARTKADAHINKYSNQLKA